jgi:hypothetical protein
VVADDALVRDIVAGCQQIGLGLKKKNHQL